MSILGSLKAALLSSKVNLDFIAKWFNLFESFSLSHSEKSNILWQTKYQDMSKAELTEKFIQRLNDIEQLKKRHREMHLIITKPLKS